MPSSNTAGIIPKIEVKKEEEGGDEPEETAAFGGEEKPAAERVVKVEERQVKKEEPIDNKDGIVRVAEIYRQLSPVVRKRRRTDKDKTFTLEGEEGDDGCANDDDEEEEGAEVIALTFVGNNPTWGRRREQEICVKEYASMSECFREYASHLGTGISYHSLRFLYDGKRLDGERAAADYGLQEGDQIDVFEHMEGGGGFMEMEETEEVVE